MAKGHDSGPALTPASAMRVGTAEDDCSDPFPPRDGCRVTPLIEAAAMYPTLERMVLEAQRSIWLAFRVFDPDTRTRSDEAMAAGCGDWTALLRRAAQRGVEIRILLTDFEPVLADYLHAASWSSFQRIRDMATDLDDEARNRIEIIVVEHEGELGWLWRQLIRLPLRYRIRKLVTTLLDAGDKDGGLEARPGLWRFLKWEGGKPSGWAAAAPPRLWPATYHQKFVVIDGEKAVLGGLDLDERRWDDRRHRQRADQTWHDISAVLEGPAVADTARHFATLWNRELPRFRAVVEEWTDGAARRLTLEPLSDAEPLIAPADEAGEATVQIVRTCSRRSGSALALGPRPYIRELKAAHRALIGAARERLYIEAQFFRSPDAARWVISALRRSPRLEVIILVANAPEEVAFEGQVDNPAHRHGEYLQTRALGGILRAGGSRAGVFTLAKQERVRASEEEFVEQRGSAFGAGLIHIHSKLLIGDDAACLLSSANINGRSFEWDTELGMIWREPGDVIAGFRRKLWAQLFGGALAEDAGLAEWRAIAADNATSKPEARKGFVLPYQLGRARRFARPYFFVPDDLV